MRPLLLVVAACAALAAQTSDPPVHESRLTVHTILREDIFAAWLENDTRRLERGERNIEVLLDERLDQRANLLAWKASANYYRAVVAHEAGKAAEFQKYFKQARDGFAQASTLKGPNSVGVPAIIGGTSVVLADRLPAENRAGAWADAYAAYSDLWSQQNATLDKLPSHLRGELLAGMAQTAQRTGRTEKATQFADRLIASLPGTTYESAAKAWKSYPKVSNLTCKSCHTPGRLQDRLAALKP
jgi:hypothetical protein